MKISELQLLERQAAEFRQKIGLSDTEAVKLKSLLLKLDILTVFSPLSEGFSGMSLRSNRRRFMLVNCNHSKCRQHFTIAHELYHLYFDNTGSSYNVSLGNKKADIEKKADAFAQRFLMPAAGIRVMIPEQELLRGEISLSTILRIGQYFSVSNKATLNRLFDLKLISPAQKEKYEHIAVKKTAMEYGYSPALYEPGNTDLVIGDFGSKARQLFEKGKISEGHYLELIHKIGKRIHED